MGRARKPARRSAERTVTRGEVGKSKTRQVVAREAALPFRTKRALRPERQSLNAIENAFIH
jgi:hypothetical protein